MSASSSPTSAPSAPGASNATSASGDASDRFEHGLNPAQRAAVMHGDGPILVLAGAGSGKTRVITNRIARLLARGVPAASILAVTFTNKAAAEMLERVVTLIGSRAAQGLTVSTFHSFGLGLLQREAKYLGFGGGFTIFDQSDAIGTVRELLRTLDIDGGRRLDASAIINRISLAKNAFHTPESMPDGGDLEGEPAIYQQVAKILFGRYLSALKGFHALDFDDLICEPVRLLTKFPEMAERWQRRFRYVLVDEYQDTNRAQLELLRSLAGAHRNLMVVGDDDQSIYAWRGADVTNILAFEEHFQGANVVKLEQNYRSTQPILTTANAVIGAMPSKKYKKELFTSRDGGDPVQQVACALPEVEASFVAAEIGRLITAGRPPSEIAVMYRSNKQSALIEEELRNRSIAYVMIGGQAFFERKEVKDLLAYMRLALNPLDEIALRRVINYPLRGVGEQALHRLEAYAIVKDLPLFRAVQRAEEVPELSSAARAGCFALTEIIIDAKAALASGKPASRVARQISDAIKLKDDLHGASPNGAAAEKRWGNVENLYRSLERFEKRVDDNAFELGAPRTPSITEFLQRLLLRFGDTAEEATEVVTLTTLHGAKGLEYEVVFLIGLEEGILPHQRTIAPKVTDVVEFVTDESGATLVDPADAGIDEERRLFYVGVTRAKERLYLCRARARQMRAQAVVRTPCRFLQDIPKELCEFREVTEVSKLNPSQMAERTKTVLSGLGGRPKF
ncbi:MAG: UvrD-helicase domain-containing protein [Polyangiales bacterium]